MSSKYKITKDYLIMFKSLISMKIFGVAIIQTKDVMIVRDLR